MDIGQLKNNHTYYDGYEGEPGITLSVKNSSQISIHIWEGYFDDLLGTPQTTERGWSGLTRDYQECVGVFSEEDHAMITDVSTYLSDLQLYAKQNFQYEETEEVHKLLLLLFRFADENHLAIEMKRE